MNPACRKHTPTPILSVTRWYSKFLSLCMFIAFTGSVAFGQTSLYKDGRSSTALRLEAQDSGIVMRHGAGPDDCDKYGAREAIVYEHEGKYYLHYDGAGPKGWLACLAVSEDLKDWELLGPVLDLGPPGSRDSAAASSPWVFHEGGRWHMFYLGTPNASPPPDRVPRFPYLTLKATSDSPRGPWKKQEALVPFDTKEDTFYAATASPGHVVKQGDEYLMFFSGSTHEPKIERTLGIARTKDLNTTWAIDADPVVPLDEQIENSSLYFEEETGVWFLFTNHIGINAQDQEYTDAIWVYWTKDLNAWDASSKAIVLDGQNCTWSKRCIGMPSVVKYGDRLAIFYDAPGGHSMAHVNRDIGMAWLDLPLRIPANKQSSLR